MYYCEPADEMALRHLFSSNLGEETLRMSYIGPVWNPSGNIEPDVDCLILDSRKDKWRILKCEFKYAPDGKQCFAGNGQFDIAIVWKICPPSTKTSLRNDLAEQNGCSEVIILSDDYPVFRRLEYYDALEPLDIEDKGVKKVEDLLLRLTGPGYASAYAAYIAAAIYPSKFDSTMMLGQLEKRFPELRRMSKQGRHNLITKLTQSKPPLISFLYHGKYRWTREISAKAARIKMDQIMRNNFGIEVPDNEIIKTFERAPQ